MRCLIAGNVTTENGMSTTMIDKLGLGGRYGKDERS